MDALTIWKFLQIAAMFIAVRSSSGRDASGAGADGDVRAARRILAAEERSAPIGGAMFLPGVVSGFPTATTSDFDLTEAGPDRLASRSSSS